MQFCWNSVTGMMAAPALALVSLASVMPAQCRFLPRRQEVFCGQRHAKNLAKLRMATSAACVGCSRYLALRPSRRALARLQAVERLRPADRVALGAIDADLA